MTHLDVRGSRCPIPVLKARKRIKSLPSGAVLVLLCDDPVATIDVPHFCQEDGHTLDAQNDVGDGVMAFHIRKR